MPILTEHCCMPGIDTLEYMVGSHFLGTWSREMKQLAIRQKAVITELHVVDFKGNRCWKERGIGAPSTSPGRLLKRLSKLHLLSRSNAESLTCCWTPVTILWREGWHKVFENLRNSCDIMPCASDLPDEELFKVQMCRHQMVDEAGSCSAHINDEDAGNFVIPERKNKQTTKKNMFWSSRYAIDLRQRHLGSKSLSLWLWYSLITASSSVTLYEWRP